MTGNTIKNRVLIAKPGLDGHDRGAKIIARALRDNEFEVIYTGIRQSPQEIVSTAIQEDVAVIGLSSLSGAHLRLFTAVIEELKNAGAADIKVLGGGIIPDEDIDLLKKAGVEEVFTPGAPLSEIITAFKKSCDDFYGRNDL